MTQQGLVQTNKKSEWDFLVIVSSFHWLSLLLKKIFAVLFFSSFSFLCVSVCTHTVTHTYTSVNVQADCSQLWQECLIYVKDVFSLTTGHFIIVKHTNIEQQTHVLDRSLGTLLASLGQISPHPALEWKKSLGKSRKFIFSLLPCFSLDFYSLYL